MVALVYGDMLIPLWVPDASSEPVAHIWTDVALIKLSCIGDEAPGHGAFLRSERFRENLKGVGF